MEAYFLKSTGDQTDRTEEIEAKLRENGICILGSGVYYVSGIVMPPRSTLMGFGECSQVILKEEIESGFAVKLATHCTVKNLTLKGAMENLPLPESVGDRHGIVFEGTATKENWGGQPKNCIIESCRIYSFSGGGITCRDTGYSTVCCVSASDCYINLCGVAINISHFSEFHKFSNMHCNSNLYACINNGGNNVFVGCAFDSNIWGFLIDNSEGQSPNNSHGTVVGCTFNHTNKNKGIGIMILGANSGYVFSDCQVFYSKIVVENSPGIQFNNLNCGKNAEIHLKGQGAILFTNCIFQKQPQFFIEDNDHVLINNCYLRNGEPVTL